MDNPLVPIQQLYENHRAEMEVVLPDFVRVKDRFKRVRAKESRLTPTCLAEVVVNDTKTKDGKFNFLIYDNHKKNRIQFVLQSTNSCLKKNT